MTKRIRTIDSRPWITLRSVARHLEISTKAATRLARSGQFASRLLPGRAHEYSKADVLCVAERSVTPAAVPADTVEQDAA